MISLDLSNVVLHGPLTLPRDVVVRFEGLLSLGCDGVVYFEDEFFPVAELAVALTMWRRLDTTDRADFEFDAMSAEEVGILWFRSFDGEWRAGSIWQESPCAATMTLEQLDELIIDYVSKVRREVLSIGGGEALTWLDKALNECADNFAGGDGSDG